MSTSPNDSSGSESVVARELPQTYALMGNPNTGKTTLFNRLCGIRAKTANFPGSTVEARIGAVAVHHRPCHMVDLPGLYELDLDRPESRVCREYFDEQIRLGDPPDAMIIVLDSTNLQRNLVLARQALELGCPAIVALSMSDLAARQGIAVNTKALSEALGCPVVQISARTGDGIGDLLKVMDAPEKSPLSLTDSISSEADVHDWVEDLYEQVVTIDEARHERAERMIDRVDRVVAHPILGVMLFAAIMTGLFYTIFSLASVPMDLIETIFGELGGWVSSIMPEGAIHDLVVDGIIGGIAGTVVFLPQICLLFFLITILEDTGYLSRAAFVMDRIMRRFGLPGQAFVPLLSAHACAIPAIMSTRLIHDRRDRIATILIAPFLSCSARMPVYVLLVGVLFPDDALKAGIAFTGCYVLGAVVALLTAFIFRRTVLKGRSAPMVAELPTYRMPSLRNAVMQTIDRGWLFLRKAGTVILGICILLWWLSAYPQVDPPAEVDAMRAQAAQVVDADPEAAAAIEAEADVLENRHAVAESFAGKLGRGLEPVFAPLGMDWQLTIGVVTSFAAREVFVSTLAVIFSGSDDAEEEGVLERIENAKRDDGSELWTLPTAAALLVFFVLAMQCLPTLPVTAREAGHWGWAFLQLGYMTVVAWVFGLATYLIVGAMA